jgi:Skp family chaperone for outer membrane proteins
MSRQNTASLRIISQRPNDPVGKAIFRESSLFVKEDRPNSKECCKVKKTPLLAVMAAGVLSLCFTLQATAQQPAAARQPAASPLAGKTVLIDVNYIFKNHARFKTAMDQLKNEADQMDVEMKKAEAGLRTKAMGLGKLNPGSEQYKSQEEDIAREKANWTIKVSQQRREFLMREAKAYNDTYREIEYAVDEFCQAQGVLLVLRFMGDPIDEANPESILAGINKPVVWYDKNLDITPYILKRFAAPARQADRTNNPAGQPGGFAPAGNSVPPTPFKR